MAGYANRAIRIDFPELTEPGTEMVHVIIRNPKLMPSAELRASVDTGDDTTDDDKLQAANSLFAKLIIGWYVFDATVVDPEADQPRLTLPATPAKVARLPLEIISRISEEMPGVNPQMPTAPQEAGTTRS